jgi:hypothetical protein
MTGRDPAAARFAVIQLVRVSGVALVLLGLLIQARRLAVFATVPGWVGYVLAVIGLLEVFLFPRLLARRWRTPPSLDDARDRK